MNVLMTLILVVQMLSALAMIGLVLLQHGKGADMGAAFGSGSSGSLFGATGGANFLSRTTAVLAAVLDTLLKLLHPVMPFVTEVLWKTLTGGESIVIADWPQPSG